MGWTELWVLKTLHGMIHDKYPAGALYLFPTRDDVKDFSKARFDPLIEQNPCIGGYVQSTDSQNIKRIGKGFLYLRGARSTKNIDGKKSSSQLKSIPVDRIVFDERDEMEDSMVTLAEERVSHSKVKEQMYLGTPTIPDYGIDQMYQDSDQRVWFIRCEACGKETCLELEFPNCIKRTGDGTTAIRVCIHCGHEIYPESGTWRPLFPDKKMTGWWISQLNSVYIDPVKIIDLYENPPHGDLSEVMNSKLGMAYIPAENRLTQNDVLATCGDEPMLNKHDGPTFMGVDVGRELHYVIGYNKTKRQKVLIKVGRCEDFNDLHDIASRFGVKSAVIDLRPEQRKVREFQKSENFQVWACEYVEMKTGQTSWDERDRIIKCNRTEICDATHELVVGSGTLELPRRNQEINQYAFEMSNIAKVLEEDEQTGSKTYRYRKLGSSRPDHYRHATNYALLASERCGNYSDKALIKKFFARRKRRSSWTV
jgi:hypothetical protein